MRARDFRVWTFVILLGVSTSIAVSDEPKAGAKAAGGSSGVQTKESQAAMTPAKALDALKAGNARFRAGATVQKNLPSKVKATAGGQFPFAAVLSCMDSRVPAEGVFDQSIGDLFSIRVAGNVVN